MNETRKLRTIVFADIAGYTATMQADEKRALQYMTGFKNIIFSEVEKFNGNIIQFFGDGCLLFFESPTDSVNCSITLQNRFREEGEIPVRIGIHLGEILIKENNAFGDGVNVASRIESLAIPGAILVSKVIRDQLKNKGDILLVSLGSFQFKNVMEPMEVFAIANPGFVIPKREEMKGKLDGKSPSKIPLANYILLVIILSVLGYFGFQYFGTNSSFTNIYEVKSIIKQEDETFEYIALVKLTFNDTIVSGIYINNIGERGIINGKNENTSLDLVFNSTFFAGECEMIGVIEEDYNSFKGKYSCSYDEFASLNAKKIHKPSFENFSKKDSIYFTSK